MSFCLMSCWKEDTEEDELEEMGEPATVAEEDEQEEQQQEEEVEIRMLCQTLNSDPAEMEMTMSPKPEFQDFSGSLVVKQGCRVEGESPVCLAVARDSTYRTSTINCSELAETIGALMFTYYLYCFERALL